MKHFMAICYVVCWVAVGTAVAAIVDQQTRTIDFTNVDEAARKATWSDPKRITVTQKGLGWDGEANASRDGWIQTEVLPVGYSWRPAQSVNIVVEIEPRLQSFKLDSGQTHMPWCGSVFVRHSPDARHWSSWQVMRYWEPEDKDRSRRRFIGEVAIPRRDREQYENYMQEYHKLDVPWASDEEALVKWILRCDPKFLEKSAPFIGYVQILYEGPFYGGQRITKLRVTPGFVLPGWMIEPKDEDAVKDRYNMPWRYRAPEESGPAAK